MHSSTSGHDAFHHQTVSKGSSWFQDRRGRGGAWTTGIAVSSREKEDTPQNRSAMEQERREANTRSSDWRPESSWNSSGNA